MRWRTWRICWQLNELDPSSRRQGQGESVRRGLEVVEPDAGLVGEAVHDQAEAGRDDAAVEKSGAYSQHRGCPGVSRGEEAAQVFLLNPCKKCTSYKGLLYNSAAVAQWWRPVLVMRGRVFDSPRRLHRVTINDHYL